MAEKQKRIVDKIIAHFGIEKVTNYIQHFYPNVDMSALTKKQAQKIITGLQTKLPSRPIMSVFGRDYKPI